MLKHKRRCSKTPFHRRHACTLFFVRARNHERRGEEPPLSVATAELRYHAERAVLERVRGRRISKAVATSFADGALKERDQQPRDVPIQ